MTASPLRTADLPAWHVHAAGVPAILLAGDRAHSRAVGGESKAFVCVSGRTMVEYVLDALLHTRGVGDIYVIGDALRLQAQLRGSGMLEQAAARGRAVHVLPQRRTLYENVWHGFLATLPPSEVGADAAHSHSERAVLVVPADIPMVIPEEIEAFLASALAQPADYVLGLTPDFALHPFAPKHGQPGIEMACFNLSEGRFRQNNLHLVRPLRMENRLYIQDMYESRYQKELGSMVRLAFRVLIRELRNAWVLIPYLLLHIGGLLDRRGHVELARFVRSGVSLRIVERCASALLRTRFVTVTTGLGGAALDVDNDADLRAADKMLPTWRSMQTEIAQTAMLSHL